MSLVTTVPASSGLDWSSSTKSLDFLPRTPPAPLISSKAIVEPFFVEIPKVAMPPVSDPYSPMRISSVDRKSTRLNSSHGSISYAVFCLNKKNVPRCRRSVHRNNLAPSRGVMVWPIQKRERVPVNLAASLLYEHFFFFNDTATTEIYTLSLHDALPISTWSGERRWRASWSAATPSTSGTL